LGDLPPNTMTQAPTFDALAAPLEVTLEHRPSRAAGPTELRALRFSIEAGLHFLRMLEAAPIASTYRQPFIDRFGLQLPAAQARADADDATRGFLQTMAGRVPDGRALEAAFRNGGAATIVADPALQIAAGDRAEVRDAALAWLDWYASVFSEPVSG